MVEVVVAIAAAALIATTICSAVDWLLNEVILSPGVRQMPLKPVIDESVLRPQDRDMIAQSQNVFREMFGEDMIASVSGKTAQERLDAVPELVTRLANLYGLSGITLRLFQEKSHYYGSYDWTNHELALNVQYLMCNDPAAIREFYDTIVHELRHAVQLQMILKPDFWGADQELRARLAYNFKHYIRVNRDPKGYMEQLVERDAFTFAYVTMEGVCKC